MPENQSEEHEEHKRVQRTEQSSEGGEGALASASAPSYPTSLLSDSRLSGRGNGPVRTAMMLQMQRTYGNRAVQRFIQRATYTDATTQFNDEKVQARTASETSAPSRSTGPMETIVIPFSQEVSFSIPRIHGPQSSEIARTSQTPTARPSSNVPSSTSERDGPRGHAEEEPHFEEAAEGGGVAAAAPAAAPSQPAPGAAAEAGPEGAGGQQGDGQPVRLPDIRIPGMANIREMDAIASALTYSPTISQTGPEPSDAFGETNGYDITVSGITVTPKTGSFDVKATVDNAIKFQVRTNKGPDNEEDITSETDAKITKTNYPTVVSDLTPDMSDLNGRPPRSKFYSKDITIRHERFHATDGQGHARDGVTLAQNRLNSRTAASIAEVNALLNTVPGIVADTRRAAMTMPGREERAYGDGAPSYTARATAIDTKGKAGDYK